MFNVTIDTRQFNQAIQDIAKYSGASLENVIEHETARVLEAAIRLTPAANVSKLRDASEDSQFAAYPADFYVPVSAQGIKHRQKVRTTRSGKIIYYRGHRYPDVLWSRMEAARKASLLKKLRARGLAKRQWLMLAQRLGLQIRAPGFVGKAVARTGKQYPEDVSARRVKTRGAFGIYCAAHNPLLDSPHVRGRSIIQRAVNGRANFTRKNLETGALYDLKKIAAKYPGLKIK